MVNVIHVHTYFQLLCQIWDVWACSYGVFRVTVTPTGH